MNPVRCGALVSLFVLGASLASTRVLGGEDTKSASTTAIAYVPAAPRDDEAIASLSFSSDATASLSVRDGGKRDLRWTAYALPEHADKRDALLRVAGPNLEVRWFIATKGELYRLPLSRESKFERTDKKSELPAMFASAPRSKSIDSLSTRDGNETLILLSADRLDWLSPTGVGVQCPYTRKADDGLEVIPPGGQRWTLTRTEEGWKDSKRGIVFRSANEARLWHECLNRMSELGMIFLMDRSADPKRATLRSGVAWFFDAVPRLPTAFKNPSILFCPADPHCKPPTSDLAWDAWRKSLNPEKPVGDLCSYATRDFSKFPLDDGSDEPQKRAVMCCRWGRDGKTPHHRGGIVVVFENGVAEFVERAALGLGPDDPIVVGPDSKSPILKTMIYLPAKK